MLKRILLTIITLIALLFMAIAALLTFGPISDPKALFSVFGYSVESPDEAVVQQHFTAPEGFSVGQYATGLPHIRFMQFSQTGDMIVSQPRQGRLLLLAKDADDNGKHDGASTLIEGLNRPQGLLFHDKWLYIGEADSVGRVEFDHQNGKLVGPYEKIITGLTDNGNHPFKFLIVHNDKLMVSMGSTCNVCEEEDKRRATIMQFDLDGNLNGNTGSIYATGLRNSVGMAITPWSNELYATDNGRDLLGDDYPPCELNKIVADKFYGWPYINGFGDLDPDYGTGKEDLLSTATSPEFGFKPHNAPLGIEFLSKSKLPSGYEKTALVALHGSWNRSDYDGYKVIALDWQTDGSITSRDFLTGFLRNDEIIGRPVDVKEGPDGCVYVSDDYSGTIYRVCYGEAQASIITATSNATDTELLALSTAAIETASSAAEKLLAQYQCLTCHNLNGDGNRSGKTLDGLKARYQLPELRDYFLNPNAPMPRFDLSDEDRHNLAVYLLQNN